jgi:4-amino-4-deoxy-L-arabinose transferase-like glycosyltransferase
MGGRVRHMSRHGRYAIVFVLIIALAIRVAAYAADLKPGYISGLAAWQAEMARNTVHHGKWFVVNHEALAAFQYEQGTRGHYIDPEDFDFSEFDRDATYQPEILEVPGLALLLSGLWWATGSERWADIQWLQIILDTGMVLLVYWIGLQLTQRRGIAVGAAALYALWPGAILLAKTPSLDTWAGFFVISALALFLWARESRYRRAKLVLLGILIGVGMYFRPFVILLPIALALGDAKRTTMRRTLESALVPTLIALVVIVPWTARNAVEFHRFIPMRSGIGQALWEGLGQRPNDFGAVNDDEAATQWALTRRPDLEPSTPAFDDFLLDNALDAIVHHPSHYAELVLRRALFLVPCLLFFAWRKRHGEDRAPLVAVAVAVILPYVFIRMEDRFWLPAAFAYLMLLTMAVAGALSRNREAEDPASSRLKIV